MQISRNDIANPLAANLLDQPVNAQFIIAGWSLIRNIASRRLGERQPIAIRRRGYTRREFPRNPASRLLVACARRNLVNPAADRTSGEPGFVALAGAGSVQPERHRLASTSAAMS